MPSPLKNVLLLMSDQHMHTSLSCLGDPHARTPALDSLAASGVHLRRAYCQDPVCTPSRACILAGRYSHSTGVIHNMNSLVNRDFVSFPQALRSKGWRTACYGKLHVPGRSDLDWDEQQEKSQEPLPPAPEGTVIIPGAINGKNPLGAPSPFGEERHPEWFAKERAIQFMKENRDRRWLLQCSMHKPHPAFQPPAKYWDTIDRSTLRIPDYPADDLDDANPGLWKLMKARNLDNTTDEDVLDALQGHYGNLAFCDAMFAEVLRTLDDLGLREETLVIYLADHGEMQGRHHLWTKFSFFEESVHVPLIVSAPGVIEGGRSSDALIELVDLYPTILELLAIETPRSAQGRSFTPVLLGGAAAHRDFVRSEFHFGRRNDRPMYMRFDGRFKFIDNGDSIPPELYDHVEDPLEIENVASRKEHAVNVAKWTGELRQWARTDVVTLPGLGEGEGGNEV